MKYFFKTLFIVTFLLGIFESCTSEETTNQTTSDEKISSSLINEIIKTAASINDYNLINFDCVEMTAVGGFLNAQGDYYGPFTIKISEWSDFYEPNKNDAFKKTGIQFTNDDYILHYIINFNGGVGILADRENIIDYFEDCVLDEFSFLPPNLGTIGISEINYNCSGKTKYFIDDVTNSFITSDPIPFSGGVTAVEEALSSYNEVNNSGYTLEQLRVSSINYISPQETEYEALGRSEMINYFEDCVLDRETNDCINFKYPLIMNKIDLQTDEIIPITITSDSELNQDFFDQFKNLTINYPITLVTLIGIEVIVESNQELETALANSAFYCTDDDW